MNYFAILKYGSLLQNSKIVINLILDRVIYARKEGEASSGSVLEAGEKITLEQASVSHKCICY